MRISIFLSLLVSRSTAHAVNVLAQAARNLKNSVLHGAASALGDGVHDDWRAFLPASLIIILLLLLPTMGAA